MDSKLQPVQLYGFSKSRLYEPLGTAIFFRNRFCPVSWILLFLPVHFYGYSLKSGRTGSVINGKTKKFPGLLCPESLEDRENQIRAQRSGFDLERRSRGVSARWLLMQSIKKPSQAMRSLRRRWQCQPILRTRKIN